MNERFRERAIRLGAELERRPTERVVITGYAQVTPLGNTEQTWQGLLEGRSGVKDFDVGNFRTNIAAPAKFDPNRYLLTQKERRLPRITQMSIGISREAGIKAGILTDEGFLRADVNKYRVGICISSAFWATQQLIDSAKTLEEKGSGHLKPSNVFKLLPEQMTGQTAIALKVSGWPMNTSEACATSASNIIEGVRLIREGYADIVFAGGFDELLDEHKEVSIENLSTLRALSTRNDEPEKASRPFDKDRDGFVVGAGGGIVVLESAESAARRGAPTLAEVLGFTKSIDGYDTTELDSYNVARTIIEAFRNEKEGGFYSPPDAIFAHATSTKIGDEKEVEAFRLVFGEELKDIPITAIKSMLGHLAGGAGAVNVVAAVCALRDGKIPQIFNLENPDIEFSDLFLVHEGTLEKELNTVLTTAYAFGGYNAAILLGKNRS